MILPGACATNPVTADREFAQIPESQEIQIGRNVATAAMAATPQRLAIVRVRRAVRVAAFNKAHRSTVAWPDQPAAGSAGLDAGELQGQARGGAVTQGRRKPLCASEQKSADGRGMLPDVSGVQSLSLRWFGPGAGPGGLPTPLVAAGGMRQSRRR